MKRIGKLIGRSEDGRRRKQTPAQTIVLGFVFLIAIGTLLLMTPWAAADGRMTPFPDALFTATSATCVTGLSTVVTAAHWTLFGQIVILILIQIGGLGFMSMAILASLLIRQTITPREHSLVAESLGTGSSDGAATSFMGLIVGGTLSVEALGAAILAIRFIPLFGVKKGIYYSIFHSISSFCNAGFDVLGDDSMISMGGEPLVLLTLGMLVIIGGIGFAVWADVIAFITAGGRRARLSERMRDIVGRRDRLSVYTKFVLIVTLILIFSGWLLTAVLEWNNALKGLPIWQKLLDSWFHSVSLRTAGFAVVDNGTLSDAGKGVSIVYMLIGGASGSTAGGLKVSTVAIVIYASYMIALGNNDVVLFKRRIGMQAITRAMTLITLGVFFVGVSSLLLTFTEGVPGIDSLYECTSAYATVGLSSFDNGLLTPFAKFWIIGLMFMGRVGILTITYSLVVKSARKHALIRYPETSFLIG